MIRARRVFLGLGALCAVCAADAGVGVTPLAHAAAPKKAAPTKARCGNGRVDPGETCDDGNTKDGDYCPSNCRIEKCKPTSTRFAVSVELSFPVNVAVGGVVVFIDYPEGAVSLPGAAAEPSVAGRISKDRKSTRLNSSHLGIS